mmetsp:Transcript_15830/g.61710  ORF Transcript_15830/g.61710 Transcript_15830/m.61710 type:complete len:251 (+) Transcript_15830:2197-2949(+)
MRVTVVVEYVVLGEVRVHQPAVLVHSPHVDQQLAKQLAPLTGAEPSRVLQPRRRHALVPDETHHEHVRSQQLHLRHPQAGLAETNQVSHFLLRPCLDHLPGVLFRVPVPPPPVPADVPVPVLEHQDGRLVHLDGQVGSVLGHRVVDVGLLPGGYAPVDLGEDALRQHLEEDETRARIERLLHRGPVRLVLDHVPRFASLTLGLPHGVAHLLAHVAAAAEAVQTNLLLQVRDVVLDSLVALGLHVGVRALG